MHGYLVIYSKIIMKLVAKTLHCKLTEKPVNRPSDIFISYDKVILWLEDYKSGHYGTVNCKDEYHTIKQGHPVNS